MSDENMRCELHDVQSPSHDDAAHEGSYACYVYGIRFIKSGHVFDGMIRYVGKSLDPQTRWQQHYRGRRCRRGKLAQCLRKHDRANFTLEILGTFTASTRGDAEREALRAEIDMIEKHGTCAGPHGLNLTLGGEGVVLEGENLENQRESGREKMRVIHSRIFADEGFLSAQAARLAEMRRNPEFRCKMISGIRKCHANPEFRIRRLAASQVARFTEDAVRRFNDGIRRRDSSSEQQLRMQATGKRLSSTYKEKAANGLRQKFKTDAAFAQRHADRVKAMCATEKHKAHLASQIQKLANDDSVKAKRSATIKNMFATDSGLKDRHQRGVDRREQNPVFKARRALGAARRWLKYAQSKNDSDGVAKHASTIRRLEVELSLTD